MLFALSSHFPQNPSDLIIAKAKEIHKCLVKALDLNHREVEFIKKLAYFLL